MANKISEIYFLTPVEYAVLLAGAGIKQVYTLQSENVTIDEGQICLAMNHLYQTGLVDSEKEQFVVREGLEELIQGMRLAEHAIFIRSGRREEKALCCFDTGKGFVATQLSEVDDNCYKIYGMNEIQLIRKVLDELLVIQNYESVLEEESLYQEIKTSRKSISKELIRKYHNLYLIVERIELKSGTVKRKMMLRLIPEGICMDAVEKGRMIVEHADGEEESIIEVLKWLMEGEIE